VWISTPSSGASTKRVATEYFTALYLFIVIIKA
jgi:hypothetical protein